MKKNIALIISIISIGIILGFYKLSILQSEIDKEKNIFIKDIKGSKEQLNNISLMRDENPIGFLESNYNKVYTLNKDKIIEEKIWCEDYKNPFRQEDKRFYRMMQKDWGFSNEDFFEDEKVRFAIKLDRNNYGNNSRGITACCRDKKTNELKKFTYVLNKNISQTYGVYHKDGVFKVLLGNDFNGNELVIVNVDFKNEKLQVEKSLNLEDIVGKNNNTHIIPINNYRFKGKPSGNTINNNWVIVVEKEERENAENYSSDKILLINPMDFIYKIDKVTNGEKEKAIYKTADFDGKDLYFIKAYKDKILIKILNDDKIEEFEIDNKFITGTNLEQLRCKIVDDKVYLSYSSSDKLKQRPKFDYDFGNDKFENKIYVVNLKNSDILYEGRVENARGIFSF